MSGKITRAQQGEFDGLLRAQRIAVQSAQARRDEDDEAGAEALEIFASDLVGVRAVLGDPRVANHLTEPTEPT